MTLVLYLYPSFLILFVPTLIPPYAEVLERKMACFSFLMITSRMSLLIHSATLPPLRFILCKTSKAKLGGSYICPLINFLFFKEFSFWFTILLSTSPGILWHFNIYTNVLLNVPISQFPSLLDFHNLFLHSISATYKIMSFTLELLKSV